MTRRRLLLNYFLVGFDRWLSLINTKLRFFTSSTLASALSWPSTLTVKLGPLSCDDYTSHLLTGICSQCCKSAVSVLLTEPATYSTAEHALDGFSKCVLNLHDLQRPFPPHKKLMGCTSTKPDPNSLVLWWLGNKWRTEKERKKKKAAIHYFVHGKASFDFTFTTKTENSTEHNVNSLLHRDILSMSVTSPAGCRFPCWAPAEYK